MTLALQREGPQLPPSAQSSLAGCLPSVRSFICVAGTYTFQQQPKPRLKSQSKAQAGVPGWVERWGVGSGEEGAGQAASRCRGPPQDHARSGASEGGVWWRGGGRGWGGMASHSPTGEKKGGKSRQPLEARKRNVGISRQLGFAGMERRLGAQGRKRSAGRAELLPHRVGAAWTSE